jgi:hypothetical protein
MRLPSRSQRLLGVPLLVIALALLLVRADVLLATRDLDVVFIIIAVYFAIEILLWHSEKRKR